MQISPAPPVDRHAAHSAHPMPADQEKTVEAPASGPIDSPQKPQVAELTYRHEQIAHETYAAIGALMATTAQRPTYSPPHAASMLYQTARTSGGLVSVTA